MQSAFRGFLLTDNPDFLDNYDKGLQETPAILAEQKELIKDNKEQLALLDSIYLLHAQWIDYANSLIKAKREIGSSESAYQLYNRLFEEKLQQKVGKKINDDISVKFLEFDRKEYILRSYRGDKLIDSIKRTHTYSFIFLTLTIIVGIGSALYILLRISRRINSMVHLAENISGGNFTSVNDNGNDELTRLSWALNSMSDRLSRNFHELEKQNEELDKFAHVVSHDLKAPIRGIHNVTNWIEEDMGNELSPQLKEYLQIIPQKTRRMEDLINGLLEYARVRKKTEPEKTDVQQLVSEIVEDIVPRDFIVELSNLPVIYAERLKLEQVFANLISNAVKYAAGSGGTISVSCLQLPNFCQFTVKDNGIGIDPEYHKKIFEIFQTLRERNQKESTGIGLAIVKRILDDQECTITVESAAGKGAAFIFTWPIRNEYEKEKNTTGGR